LIFAVYRGVYELTSSGTVRANNADKGFEFRLEDYPKSCEWWLCRETKNAPLVMPAQQSSG
jgi:hypothetical protein